MKKKSEENERKRGKITTFSSLTDPGTLATPLILSIRIIVVVVKSWLVLNVNTIFTGQPLLNLCSSILFENVKNNKTVLRAKELMVTNIIISRPCRSEGVLPFFYYNIVLFLIILCGGILYTDLSNIKVKYFWKYQKLCVIF